MPIGWLQDLANVGAAVQRTAQSSGTMYYRGKPVTYVADRTSGTPGSVYQWDGHVRIAYDLDVFTADHVEAHLGPDELFVSARGHIRLIDPDASLISETLTLSWKADRRFATGTQAQIKISDAVINAESIDVRPDRWTFERYTFTTDPSSRPLYYFKGREAVIRPGRSATLHDSALYIFGRHVIGYQTREISLNPRSSGLGLPTPEYRGGKGLGYTWTLSSSIDRQTVVQAHTDAAPKELPGYGAILTHSFLSLEQSPFPISPLSQFGLRFQFSYMDSVLVDRPSDEINFLAQPRHSISSETSYNAVVTGRGRPGEVFSVASSVQYEAGGKLGHSAYLSDLKVEDIDSYRGPYTIRTDWVNSFELPARKLADSLYAMTRLDSGTYRSAHTYLWVRGTGSLIYHPTANLTLGGALFAAVDDGTPDLDIDPLYYRTGGSARADYRLGPRSLSLMLRYDTRLGFFDYEYQLTQAVGPLEAFVSYRKYPGDFHLGLMFRVDQFEDLLVRRNWKKSSKLNSVGIP